MRYLVTGCAGFIASRITRRLVEAGHEVVGVDDLNVAYDPALKLWRLERLRPLPNFTFHRADIADRAALAPIFDSGFDAVFNMAARAGVRQSLEDPWVYIETNAKGMLNLLDLARRHDVPRVLLSSTSSLYGANDVRPFREDTSTDRPLSPYAASKKAAESMCAAYAHLYGMHTPVLRYFTVYGPAGRPDMSIFRFIRWVAEGEPVVVYGDGAQERDFTYVDDIAEGTIAALGARGFDVFNLGGDSPHRLDEVLTLVEKHVGRAARVEHRPVHRADVRATWADIGHAREVLGWSPKVSLDEGVRRTAAWYAENRSWASKLECGDK